MRIIATILLLLATVLLHVMAIFLLYRGRYLGYAICNSDLFVFFVPSVLALAIYFSAGRLRWSEITSGIVAGVATLVSFSVAMTVAINVYGG